MLFDKLMLMMIAVVATTAVPITKNATDYDLSQFNQVHDQRQTGKGNFKLNIDGVAVMITTPEELLQSALLIAPALIEGSTNLLDFIMSVAYMLNPRIRQI